MWSLLLYHVVYSFWPQTSKNNTNLYRIPSDCQSFDTVGWVTCEITVPTNRKSSNKKIWQTVVVAAAEACNSVNWYQLIKNDHQPISMKLLYKHTIAMLEGTAWSYLQQIIAIIDCHVTGQRWQHGQQIFSCSPLTVNNRQMNCTEMTIHPQNIPYKNISLRQLLAGRTYTWKSLVFGLEHILVMTFW